MERPNQPLQGRNDGGGVALAEGQEGPQVMPNSIERDST